MSNNLVTICVPIYNCEEYIEKCVSTLLSQTYQNIEYIFIDDASSDNSYNCLKKLINNYPSRLDKIHLYRHEKNLGVSVTRLEAIKKANGDFIIHCDGDDFVDLDWIETLVYKATETNADMVYCWHYRCDRDGKDICMCKEQEISEPVEIIKSFFEARMHCSLCNKLYRKEVYERTGQLDCPEWINMCEDFRINAQLIFHCKKIVMEAKALYHYRMNHTSLTRTLRNKKSFLSEIDNVNFFKRYLPQECLPAMEGYQRRTLLEALMCDAMTAELWHSLWKDVKWKTYKAQYPWKLKVMLYLACINQPFAVWLWKIMKKIGT